MGRPSPVCRNQQHERLAARGAREEGRVREARAAAAAALLPQRRPRQSTAGGPLARACSAAAEDASAAEGGRAGGRVATRRCLTRGCSRPASNRLPPVAACSFAVLAFLGDPAASFQVRPLAVRGLPGGVGTRALFARRWPSLLGEEGASIFRFPPSPSLY